jgi:hypothetical protein
MCSTRARVGREDAVADRGERHLRELLLGREGGGLLLVGAHGLGEEVAQDGGLELGGSGHALPSRGPEPQAAASGGTSPG